MTITLHANAFPIGFTILFVIIGGFWQNKLYKTIGSFNVDAEVLIVLWTLIWFFISISWIIYLSVELLAQHC